MATILPFTPTTHVRPKTSGEGPAAIVFFPGVRYERGEEIVAGKASAASNVTNGDKPARSKH